MANYGQAAIDTANRRLKPFSTSVDPDDLTAELTQASLLIRTKYVSVGAYDALMGTDQEWFDTAVGTLTAIMLLGNAALTANDGLSKLETPDFKYTFATPDKDAQDKLVDQLQQALSFISAIQDDRIAIADTLNIFGVTGRSRTRECAGRPSLSTIIESLLPSGWGGNRPSPAMFTPIF